MPRTRNMWRADSGLKLSIVNCQLSIKNYCILFPETVLYYMCRRRDGQTRAIFLQ